MQYNYIIISIKIQTLAIDIRVENGIMKQKLIYIENHSTDPHYNLAFEEYVFQNLDFSRRVEGPESNLLPVLLLWQNEPSVIIGKFQNTIEEINYDYIREKGIHVVRRNTGGGAVYHDLGNLNYSFIIPGAETKVDFKTFTIPIVKALNSYGIPAEQTGRNDILVDGKKFSGNAQQFSKHSLLHHGTIMFDVDVAAVGNALRVKPGKFKSKATKSVRSRVTNLKPFFEEAAASHPALEEGIRNAADLKALLLEWFKREYDVTELHLNASQRSDIERLKREKYDTRAWNFGKSPKADVVRGDFFPCGQVEFHFTIKEHKIRSVRITGDFFAAKDIQEFERLFENCDYTKAALGEVLRNADLTGYLGDVTAEELLNTIV